MKESTTYQSVLNEGVKQGLEQGLQQGLEQGRAREARQTILRLGTKRFGPPADADRNAIEAVENVETLEAIIDRLIEVDSWQQLLTS